ncbi:hypothetical protein L202_06643 [Cryptococcus amylolentus CBS 6039]|uniref:N-acetyltransferase 9-like protein n=1 Tax=Cryptococcus amylolentus CBS 6039 TaxID=1295533 RepID=A0A1E3HGP8_9TREE|nr:hypothetical protein L202_06643 [Cryptococcus amylolentus CBS 6039]ODN75517.1 hypothetical protein L202_06643 [Cryptococcus amylolentus CBS 6039]
MKLNENSVIFGDKVILVPYRAEHVPEYHEWMKSLELLELTASEPLSLGEEYKMQRKWLLDEDKLTFILLARPSPPSDSSTDSSRYILQPEEIQKCRMVGDVNLFLPDGREGEGECEIMIASKEDRRKGYAVEALSLFLKYATSYLHLPAPQLLSRIGSQNIPSIRLFKKLGFGVVKYVKVFDEVEMRFGQGDIEGMDLDYGVVEEGKEVDWEGAALEGRVGVYEAGV